MNIATNGLLRAVGLALAGTLALAAPAVSRADGIGYSISVGGPGYGVSYGGCGDCRGWASGWVSSGWGDDDGWYPARPVYVAPAYYGYYRRPVVVYRGYEHDGWHDRGDWHREHGWHDRGWRGGDRGWHGRGGHEGGWHDHHGDGGD